MTLDFITKDNYPKQSLLYLYFERLFELGELIKQSQTLEERIKYIEEIDSEISGRNIYWWQKYMKLVLDPETIDALMFYKYQDKNGQIIKVPIIHRNKFLQNIDLSNVDWNGVTFDIDNEDIPKEIKTINNKRKWLGTKRKNSNSRMDAEFYFDYTDTNISHIDFSKIEYLKNVKFDGIDLSTTNIECVKGLYECSLENCNIPPDKVIRLIELIVQAYEKEKTTKYRFGVMESILKNSFKNNQSTKPTISCPLLIISKAIVDMEYYSLLDDLSSLVEKQVSFSISKSDRKNIVKELSYYNQDWEEYEIWAQYFGDDFEKREEEFPEIFGERYNYMEDVNGQRRKTKYEIKYILDMIKKGLFNGCTISCQESNKTITISKETTPKEFLEAFFPELSQGKYLDYYNGKFRGDKILKEESPKDNNKSTDDDRKYEQIITEYKELINKLDTTYLQLFITPLIRSGQVPNVVDYVKMTKREKTIFIMWIAECLNNNQYSLFAEYKENIRPEVLEFQKEECNDYLELLNDYLSKPKRQRN